MPTAQWSDFAFLSFQNSCQVHESNDPQCLSSLNYVVSYEITNPTAWKIATGIIGGPLKPFPGFMVKGWQLALLLGTPNGSGVAWLLITHVPQFGRKWVDQIHIFGSTSGKLCLAFHIGTPPDAMVPGAGAAPQLETPPPDPDAPKHQTTEVAID